MAVAVLPCSSQSDALQLPSLSCFKPAVYPGRCSLQVNIFGIFVSRVDLCR